jgi:hypothetical protein
MKGSGTIELAIQRYQSVESSLILCPKLQPICNLTTAQIGV